MSNSMMLRWFVLVIFLGCLLYYLSPIITPFFLGVLLAYLGNPMVTYCHHKKNTALIGCPRCLYGAHDIFNCSYYCAYANCARATINSDPKDSAVHFLVST
ncbi:MAG: hypothetical protein LRY67_07040 [Gammaproteobacteria bacterium]|nr:hypothetical protein [Gammaproteobacteria bacterium]